jgi:adenosylcobinamide-phosphate synthase
MTPLRLTLAYALDVLAGDPEGFPHPVRLFGSIIRAGERWLRRPHMNPATEVLSGTVLTGAVISVAWWSGKWSSGKWSGKPCAGWWQVLLAWTTLATRNLIDESGAVIRTLETGDLPLARQRLARIVGRDTTHLTQTEIARAVIETLAESACDGIVAPLFWLATGGLPWGMAYKAINTLDSMIGHREPPYRYFGSVAARLDDAANLFPARLTALAIAASAAMHGQHGRESLRIWQRDGYKHESPNAGQSEAAMAGALGVRLGGTNFYDGRPHYGPILCEEGRSATIRDAKTAVTIVATVSGLAFGAALLVLARRRRK